MTADLEANDYQMNDPIDQYLSIDNYFEHIDDCVQCAKNVTINL